MESDKRDKDCDNNFLLQIPLYYHLTHLHCNSLFLCNQTAFLGRKKDDFGLLCDGKLINFLSSYFKIEIICISRVVSVFL